MDPRERFFDLQELLQVAMEGAQSNLWTALPCIVNSWNPENQSITAKPAIKVRSQAPDGTVIWRAFPLLLDVPVIFQSAGGYTLTFPVKPGDEALVVFASRCIDNWWRDGGFDNEQIDVRMHNLSDGFAFIGPRSRPRVLPAISASGVQLRSDDGSMFVHIEQDQITMTHPSRVVVNAPDMELNAATALTVSSPTSTFTGELVVEGLLTYQDGVVGESGTNGTVINGPATFEAAVVVTGPLTYESGITGTGTATINSDISLTGNLTQSGGALTSNGIQLDTHYHSGVTPGGSNTSGPH